MPSFDYFGVVSHANHHRKANPAHQPFITLVATSRSKDPLKHSSAGKELPSRNETKYKLETKRAHAMNKAGRTKQPSPAQPSPTYLTQPVKRNETVKNDREVNSKKIIQTTRREEEGSTCVQCRRTSPYLTCPALTTPTKQRILSIHLLTNLTALTYTTHKHTK